MSKFSHNITIYGELGRYPCTINHYKTDNGLLFDKNIDKFSEDKLNKVMHAIFHCKNVLVNVFKVRALIIYG